MRDSALFLLAGPLLMGAASGAAASQPGEFDVAAGALRVAPRVDSPTLPITVSTETTAVLNLGYSITDQVRVATALALPRHELFLAGASAGKVSLAPFNLTVQYRFLPGARFRPYLGIGGNYTVFFNQGGSLSGFEHFKSKLGGVLQAGFDYELGKRYFVNVDVKKFYIRTDVTPKGGATLETLRLDPLVTSASFGVRM